MFKSETFLGEHPQSVSMAWFFLFFSVSGFCSILYELVWLRLSTAVFGVTTALTSIVLSVFMAGLGLGAWGSGRVLRRYQTGLGISLLVYAAIEVLTGSSALLVPTELQWGRILSQQLHLSSSPASYAFAGVWIAIVLLPWCACMGATLPLGMRAIRSAQLESKRSFSYLYLANICGALLGTLIPLLLIELRGFLGTLEIGAGLNFSVGLAATLIALRGGWGNREVLDDREAGRVVGSTGLSISRQRGIPLLLFGTGFSCMAMEVVWIRQFTPFLGTMVYAFAAILGVYLFAVSIGAQIYRLWSRTYSLEPAWTWSFLGLCGLLPVLTTNLMMSWWPNARGAYPEPTVGPLLRLFAGIAPFSLVLGFVTPMLVDRWSGGNPSRAGTAYGINVLGCIAGPLISGFVLLPLMNERFALLVLAAPWFLIGLRRPTESNRRSIGPVLPYAMLLAAVPLMASSRNYEDGYPVRQVFRDHTASVIAANSGRAKYLFVNGVGITSATPITKMMAHLPMASLDRPPQNALVICFGMGTTFRSLLSWSIPVTAVELVPSVPRTFGFFHEDGPALLQSPNAHLVIDDGRRYLERTSEQYDVITIDPPPPVSAAGSSLLYAREFYGTVRKRLRPGGILAQWFPEEQDVVDVASVTKALRDSFPYVRAFPSVEGSGIHFLASDRPIVPRSAEELVSHMPRSAIADMMEWEPQQKATSPFASMVEHEILLDSLTADAPLVPMLTDDRPVNEYFLLRSLQ